MERLGRTHKDVVPAVLCIQREGREHSLELGRNDIYLLFRRPPFLLRGTLDIDTVLIGSCKEERIESALPLVSANCVRDDRSVQMPEMRQAVRIVDRRRDVESF